MTHNRHENRQTLDKALALMKYSCTNVSLELTLSKNPKIKLSPNGPFKLDAPCFLSIANVIQWHA